MVLSVETIRSHIITMTIPPPTHQPVVAAMIGLSDVNPTVGMRAPQFRQVGDVGAGGEGAFAGGAEDRDALVGGIEGLERLLHLDRDGAADRVQLLRPVDADDRDRAVLFGRDDAHWLRIPPVTSWVQSAGDHRDCPAVQESTRGRPPMWTPLRSAAAALRANS